VGEGEGEGGTECSDDELKVGLSSWTTISLADFAAADMLKVFGGR